MAFDWREFFLLAHELRNEPAESKQRTAIGRAYYYAYHAAKVEAKKLGFNEDDPSLRNMGLHRGDPWRRRQHSKSQTNKCRLQCVTFAAVFADCPKTVG